MLPELRVEMKKSIPFLLILLALTDIEPQVQAAALVLLRTRRMPHALPRAHNSDALLTQNPLPFLRTLLAR